MPALACLSRVTSRRLYSASVFHLAFRPNEAATVFFWRPGVLSQCPFCVIGDVDASLFFSGCENAADVGPDRGNNVFLSDGLNDLQFVLLTIVFGSGRFLGATV